MRRRSHDNAHYKTPSISSLKKKAQGPPAKSTLRGNFGSMYKNILSPSGGSLVFDINEIRDKVT